MMTFEEYQDGVCRTLNGKGAEERPAKEQISYLCMGLAGESGEMIDLIKKWLYHGHEMDYAKLNKEMGDVLWYLTALIEEFNFELEGVAQNNMAKLRARYPEGFSHERSINRNDEPSDDPGELKENQDFAHDDDFERDDD